MTSNNEFSGTFSGGPANLNSAEGQAEEAARAAEDLRRSVERGVAKAHDAGEEMQNKATQGALQANDQLNQAISSAGQQLQSAARQVRQLAPEGQAAALAASAADLLERGGGYLQSADTSTIVADVEYIVRRYPLQALAVGFGLGLVLGRRGK